MNLGMRRLSIVDLEFGKQPMCNENSSIWMINIPGNNRIFVFIPYLIIQVVYSAIIIKKARMAGLLDYPSISYIKPSG